MPELLTKHPDVALQVLKSQGAQCGVGIKPKILTQCPPEKFCLLSGGELCVYGSHEIEQMTQMSRAEICGAPPKSAVAPIGLETSAMVAAPVALLVLGLFRAWRSRRSS